MTPILQGRESISKPCEPVFDIQEGELIAKQLFDVLNEHEEAIGLAANQIGINKSVCVIRVEKPIWFMNPAFHPEGQEMISFFEQCLSFVGETVETERFKKGYVTASNHDIKIDFGPWNVLECICVQHEIEHLSGKTMYDSEVKNV